MIIFHFLYAGTLHRGTPKFQASTPESRRLLDQKYGGESPKLGALGAGAKGGKRKEKDLLPPRPNEV